MSGLPTIIAVFAVLAVIFQVVAHRTFTNEVFWAKTDYVWLCVAALGLVSLAAEARRDSAVHTIYVQKQYILDLAALAEDNVAFSVAFLNAFSEIKVKEETSEVIRQKREFMTLKERLLPYIEYFGAWPRSGWASSTSAFHNEDALLKGLTDQAALKRAASVVESIDAVKKAYDDLLKMETELNASELERLRIYLAPLLLAAAVAVRLGKTTAEVKRKRKGK